MKNANRNMEFDILRAVIIFSAIVLHFNANYSLEPFSLPFKFIDKYIFKVGHFFFFTAGYMACLIYEKRFSSNPWRTTINIFNKGIHLLFIYIGYVLLMTLLRNNNLPENLYDFVWNHHFYTKVIFTFSALYMLSPIILIMYQINKIIFYILFIILYGSYTNYYLSSNMDSYFLGIFFGIGNKDIFYSFSSAILLYIIGYILCNYERNKNILSINLTSLIAFFILIIHLMLVTISPFYRDAIESRKLSLLITSSLIYSSVLCMRKMLCYKPVTSFFSKPAFCLIGIKSLSFYMISNMFLGLLVLPTDLSVLHNLIIFLAIVSLSYLFTAWHFYSGYHL